MAQPSRPLLPLRFLARELCSVSDQLPWEVKCVLGVGPKDSRVQISVNCFECIKHRNGNSDFKIPVSPEKIISFRFCLYGEKKIVLFCSRKPKRKMPFF